MVQTPWVIHKGRDEWVNETYHRNMLPGQQAMVSGVSTAKKQNQKLKQLNNFVYMCISIVIVILLLFFISAFVKLRIVHYQKILYAIILIFIVNFIAKALKISM